MEVDPRAWITTSIAVARRAGSWPARYAEITDDLTNEDDESQASDDELDDAIDAAFCDAVRTRAAADRSRWGRARSRRPSGSYNDLRDALIMWEPRTAPGPRRLLAG
ncbi:hypothetical protein WEI85_29570 [Actinomycetes bacterium KLBMP 9797]